MVLSFMYSFNEGLKQTVLPATHCQNQRCAIPVFQVKRGIIIVQQIKFPGQAFQLALQLGIALDADLIRGDSKGATDRYW